MLWLGSQNRHCSRLCTGNFSCDFHLESQKVVGSTLLAAQESDFIAAAGRWWRQQVNRHPSPSRPRSGTRKQTKWQLFEYFVWSFATALPLCEWKGNVLEPTHPHICGAMRTYACIVWSCCSWERGLILRFEWTVNTVKAQPTQVSVATCGTSQPLLELKGRSVCELQARVQYINVAVFT